MQAYVASAFAVSEYVTFSLPSPASSHDTTRAPLPFTVALDDIKWAPLVEPITGVVARTSRYTLRILTRRRIVIPPLFDLFEVFRESFAKEKLSGWC